MLKLLADVQGLDGMNEWVSSQECERKGKESECSEWTQIDGRSDRRKGSTETGFQGCEG